MLIRKVVAFIAAFLTMASIGQYGGSEETARAKKIVLQNEYATYVIGADGKNLSFLDKRSGKEYCARKGQRAFMMLKKDGTECKSTACSYSDGKITVQFGESGITAVVKATCKKHYFVFELVSISDEKIEELVMSQLHLTITENIGTTLNVARDDQFAACLLALNLQVNSRGRSGSEAILWSACYPRFGLVGAKVALIGCPSDGIRAAIKEVVKGEGLPYSPLGGAWAVDAPETRGSYLFANNISEANAEQWIRIAKEMGATHIHICQNWWRSTGHYEPNPARFPHGMAGLKAVVDKIHAAGLKAGMHTFTGCIQKRDPYVHPVPDRRLAKDATFTLAQSVAADARTIPTTEPPGDLPTESGYWVAGGNDIQIGDEIITYTGISNQPPYGFTGCQRGARRTRAAAHKKGIRVEHLTQKYRHYLPDGDSTLVDELARHVADVFNTCGFDMIYFDGAEAMAGCGPGWHYVAKMKLAIFSKFTRRCLVESSSFGHHTWHIRSRLGAWDNPYRGTKRFLDKHIKLIPHYRKNLLPIQLGWWALHGYRDQSCLTTRPDEIEYLCAKCLGHDIAFSMQGLSPARLRETPAWAELLSIMGRYEQLRLSNYFPESIKAKLRVPKDEFTLVKNSQDKWRLAPVEYAQHKVTAIDGASNVWKVNNRFAPQPLKLRIEALLSPASYDSPEATLLTDFSDASKLASLLPSERKLIARIREAAPGVTRKIEASTDEVKIGKLSGCYTATNSREDRVGWSRMAVGFSPPLDLKGKGSLGVWVHGDGKGEVLNFQLGGRGQESQGDHYVIIDYKGWRYHELVEPEGERVYEYNWPYWHMHVTRGGVPYGRITRLKLYYHNIPPGETVTCYLSPVKALPTVKVKLRNPSVEMAGKRIVFPVTLESGCYIEFNSMSDCKLYDERGALVQQVRPRGGVPRLAADENQLKFTCEGPEGFSARANVTVITCGEPLQETAAGGSN